MRIKCTVKEMAIIIRACENASCTDCALWDMCSIDNDKGKNVEDFIEIVPEDKGEQVGVDDAGQPITRFARCDP